MKIIEGGITAVAGIKAAGVKAGIKKADKEDLALIFSEKPAVAAGVFTTNLVKAPSIIINQDHIVDSIAQAIVANSGNANACTGKEGFDDAMRMVAVTAQELNIPRRSVLVTSTGVIGQRLPMDKVESGIRLAVKSLSYQGGHQAALAIMTTDTVPKEIAVETEVGEKKVRIGGIAKGAGMIRPDMATMHSFITTDVDISADMLRKALKASVDKSFNMITVDGDMSTSDTVLILATGSAKNPKIIAESSHYKQFLDALEFVTIDLAKKIVKDGEGATKLVHVIVNGARDLEAAKKAARAVAESNLVKTAIFGMDANWGRIMAALGYSGAIFSPDQVDIWLEDLQLVKDGISANFSEDIARELFKKDELSIVIDLRSGEAKATMWTCDFSYDYVKINAAYRT